MATFVPVRLPELTNEQCDALSSALARAMAAERSEVVRLNRLGSTGYEERAGGSETQTREIASATARIEVMGIVLEAVKASR